MKVRVVQPPCGTLPGYSAGATLAYAAFVQGPSGRFQGLITEAFCSDQITVRPVGGIAGRSIGARRPEVSGRLYGPATLPGRWALGAGRWALGAGR